MSVAVIPMAKELGWSAMERGLVSSSFFWGYSLTQIPAGWVSTRWGRGHRARGVEGGAGRAEVGWGAGTAAVAWKGSWRLSLLGTVPSSGSSGLLTLCCQQETQHTPACKIGALTAACYLLTALLAQLPDCLLACSIGGARVLFAGVALWSLGTLIAPPAAKMGLVALCATRLFVGLGEGLAPSSATNVMARIVPE